jgi:hypothetical protein
VAVLPDLFANEVVLGSTMYRRGEVRNRFLKTRIL